MMTEPFYTLFELLGGQQVLYTLAAAVIVARLFGAIIGPFRSHWSMWYNG